MSVYYFIGLTTVHFCLFWGSQNVFFKKTKNFSNQLKVTIVYNL